MKIINVYEGLNPDLPIPLAQVQARGQALLSNGQLGVDLIYLLPNQAFPPHTHPGDHLLLVLEGAGTVTVGGTVYPTRPGDLYMVEGGLTHAVGAGPEGHYLLSFGSPHTALDHPDRMTVVRKVLSAEC